MIGLKVSWGGCSGCVSVRQQQRVRDSWPGCQKAFLVSDADSDADDVGSMSASTVGFPWLTWIIQGSCLIGAAWGLRLGLDHRQGRIAVV